MLCTLQHCLHAPGLGGRRVLGEGNMKGWTGWTWTARSRAITHTHVPAVPPSPNVRTRGRNHGAPADTNPLRCPQGQDVLGAPTSHTLPSPTAHDCP